ncbi:MAG: PLP-dependent transferase, partial [Ottowia sp.]|nr:PLP-dependent transferase [Ottowia sp.]
TLPLRYRAQGESGLALARWCAQQPPFVQVLHPALPGAPGHAHWQQLCGGTAAGLFSVIIDARYSSAQVDAFCEALRLFKLGYSWGGPVSLVMPYEARALRGENWPPHLRRGHVVRFAVGLEDAADLQADLQQAMARTLPPF